MGPKEAAVWYSTRGCESAKMSAEETRDWLEQLHGLRSANLARLEDWAKQLTAPKENHFELCLPLAEADKPITLLNDHPPLPPPRPPLPQQANNPSPLSAFN